MTKSDPAISLTENILRRELSGAHFFVAPKYVAYRVTAFGYQTICQADRFDRLVVVNGHDLDAGLFLELLEYGFGVNLVLRAIRYNTRRSPGFDLSR
jgi:hypothetical protein